MAEFLNAKKNGPKAKPVASSDVGRRPSALQQARRAARTEVLPARRRRRPERLRRHQGLRQEAQAQDALRPGQVRQKVKLAAGDECENRPFCQPGLEKTYGIDVTGIDPKGVGTTQSKQAVKDGKDQLVLTTTTDATLDQFGLVLLKDDKKLQNADNVLPVVNAKDAGGKKVAGRSTS